MKSKLETPNSELGTQNSELATERINPVHAHMDELSTLDLLKVMNDEDHTVSDAVAAVLPEVAQAVEIIAQGLRGGGRLFYVGAGTSGRLGALDASECPPTFSVNPDLVQPIIAGGFEALRHSVEGAEDSEADGSKQVVDNEISPLDVVCGISASGSTPFVLGALKEARDRGARTIGLACNRPALLDGLVDVMIAPITGPEVLSGSTRLRAGTAQKMVLNMLSTAAMVRLGKVYGNLMVDVRPVNRKLVDRAQRIIRAVTGLDEGAAQELFDRSGRKPKVAIVMHRRGCSAADAERLLDRNDGFVKAALADPGQ